MPRSAPGTGTNDDADAAYIWWNSGTGWIQNKRLWDPNPLRPNDFGRAVGIAGDHAAIGSPDSYDGTGAVTVYQRSGSDWTSTFTLLASNDDEDDDEDEDEEFGSTIAMTTNRIVVGAPGWDGGIKGAKVDQGRAFVFDGSGANWTLKARLTAEGGLPENEAAGEGRAGDRFGASLAVDGRYVVVGAPDYDGDANEQGAAYVFYELPDLGSGNGPTWTRSTGPVGSGRLDADEPAGTDPDAPRPDNFGASVAISGNRIVVGRPGFNDTRRIQGVNLNSNVTVSEGDWVRLGEDIGSGLQGEIYRYQGSATAVSFSASTDFSNADLWRQVPVHRSDATPAPTVEPDDYVLLTDNIGNGTAGQLYKYLGSSAFTGFASVDFSNQSLWLALLNSVILRGDVGGFQSFTTNGTLPAFQESRVWAETLTDPVGGDTSRFGSVTHYDPASRTLFVSDPAHNVVYAYINEGLYWRPLPKIESPDRLYVTSEGLTATYSNWSFFNSQVVHQGVEWSIFKGTTKSGFAPKVSADYFNASWSGKITSTHDQWITLYLRSNDFTSVSIGNSLAISHPGGGNEVASQPIWMEKGKEYNLEVTTTHWTGDARIELRYQWPGSGKRLLTGPFGTDIDVSGDRMVIAAPDAKAYVYQRNGEEWNRLQELEGAGGFGRSVAISGNAIVVGMPDAPATYRSLSQPIADYNLPLGARVAPWSTHITATASRRVDC